MTKLTTVPNDKVLFPATNQTHYCWQKYNEWILTARNAGFDETHGPSIKARNQALMLCPAEWIQSWDDMRAEGKFVGIQDVPPTNNKH